MYSQNGEDDIIASIFGAKVGRLLEIGAWDPKDFSNSRLLIERGWEALLCEFSPCPLRNQVCEYRDNPRVKVIAAAISPLDEGFAEYELSDDGLSSLKPDEKWRETGGFYGKAWFPTVPLARLLAQFDGGHDFVSIDTEGTSVGLALTLLGPLEQRPTVLCVEHNDRILELAQFAEERGYHVVKHNQENLILANV